MVLFKIRPKQKWGCIIFIKLKLFVKFWNQISHVLYKKKIVNGNSLNNNLNQKYYFKSNGILRVSSSLFLLILFLKKENGKYSTYYND